MSDGINLNRRARLSPNLTSLAVRQEEFCREGFCALLYAWWHAPSQDIHGREGMPRVD